MDFACHAGDIVLHLDLMQSRADSPALIAH
jgi:hypothetical protein